MIRAKQLCRHSSWKWYGVRSLYRLVALGKPKDPDASFVPDATLVEERIVLIKARSDEEALRKAEKEGKNYARSIHFTNGYGQKVKNRMLKVLDVYELFDSLRSGAEIFSVTEEIDASVADKQLGERLIGGGEPLDQQEDPWRRLKFIDVNVVKLMLEHLQEPSSSC
jgi:hypothetical protein